MRKYSEQEKQEMIQDWRSSEQTKKVWCKANGITVKTLYNWLKGNRSDAERDVKWAQVNIKGQECLAETGNLEIQFGGVTVKIQGSVNRESFRIVCEELIRIC